MQPNERYDIILQLLSSKEMVTIPELMDLFDVSIETVRRDLNYLDKNHFIKKVYGGAILFNKTGSGNSSSYALRIQDKLAEKQAIARKCAESIRDGDVLFLGPGTTVLQVARNIKDRHNLSVMTTSIYVVTELIGSDAEILFVGGKMSNRDVCTMVPFNSPDLESFSPPKAIIGASGVTLKYGITDYNYMMSLILKKIIARAKSITVVADSSKFGISDPGITCPLSMVNTIITDSNRKDVIMEEFEEYRQRLVFAEDIMPSGENPFEEHTDLTQQLLS